MVRLIAAIICALGIWQLFRLNREREVQTSKALWIPVFWLFIAASRNFAEWLHYSPVTESDRYLEGNPLDRAILSAILILGIIVLLGRGRRVGMLLQSNIPILLYFLYCASTVLWSDFPDVAFKRWFRGLGDVVMILIVLSDPNWLAAVRRLFSRVGFVVVPVSILFIRYFPDLGRTYDKSGQPEWTGVGTDKNALGMICLIFGLAALFRFLQVRQGKETPGKRGPLIAQGGLIVMAAYLLYEAHSATAISCFLLGGGVMVLTQLLRAARRPAVLHLLVATVVIVPISAMFLGIGSGLLTDLGRNSTFTGRTAIWHAALGIANNPLLGAGYESFWLGQRLNEVSRSIQQGVNQAHNGYIEIYLNLGWVGLVLLACLFISGYKRIVPAVRRQMQGGSLRLAFFVVAVAYNLSEGGFKMMHPVWIVFLLSIVAVPEVTSQESPELKARIDDWRSVAEKPATLSVSVRQNRDVRLPGPVWKSSSRAESLPAAWGGFTA
jgi:exopolysaccharide production protein ExoQ